MGFKDLISDYFAEILNRCWHSTLGDKQTVYPVSTAVGFQLHIVSHFLWSVSG